MLDKARQHRQVDWVIDKAKFWAVVLEHDQRLVTALGSE